MLKLITFLRNQAVLVIGHWVAFKPPTSIFLSMAVPSVPNPCCIPAIQSIYSQFGYSGAVGNSVTCCFLVPCTYMSSACFRVLVQIVCLFPDSIAHQEGLGEDFNSKDKDSI